MKIVICTTPIRPEPTEYPPFGAMALIKSLRLSGHDPYFYDIDGLRHSFDQVVDFFREEAPDIVGISAVVSTAYAYTKRLALAIKEVSPGTKIVVGGNLAASAELLLRLCKVDVCGIGEGEQVMTNLVRHWESNPGPDGASGLRDIKGLTYLDQDGEMVFTGYEVAIPATEFLDPDWTILEQYSNIERFITNPLARHDFAQDPRSYEPHRQGKKLADVHAAKGCVARCTFCHRWDKGYRHWPVDRIVSNIQYLMNRYNVGFISFADENFGSDRKKLDELIERIKPLDILYKVAGVRCRTVDPELLQRLKESGCVAMYYGMETGSSRMLDIMEKNTTLEMNINAARWTHEVGIYTIYQLVLGMPGEDHLTIGETVEFIKNVTEFLPDPPNRRLSINYIQALPGTPVYEYAREKGHIGASLEEEEKYLINISDIDAADDTKFINFTEYDYLTVQSWRPRIVFNAEMNWHQKRNWQRLPTRPQLVPSAIAPDSDTEAGEDYSRGGYFNLGHTVFHHPILFRVLSNPLCYPPRTIYPAAYILFRNFQRLSLRKIVSYLWEYVYNKLRKYPRLRDFRSLRQVMNASSGTPSTKSEENMLPMRQGR